MANAPHYAPLEPQHTLALAPAVPERITWVVLRGGVRLTYGAPVADDHGGSLSLDQPRTVDLTPSSPPFVVFPGMSVIYRATVDGTLVERRAA